MRISDWSSDVCSSDLKDLAARVEAAQAPEIARLEGWLGEWGEDLPMEGMDMDHGQDGMGMMSDKDMSMLESASGAEFDRLFLEMMVRHHSGAIEMAEEELRDGQHAGAVEMAPEIKEKNGRESWRERVCQYEKIW